MTKTRTPEQAGNRALSLLIRQAIEESGKLGREIAEQCGVKPQAVSNWKTTGRIDKQNLEKLAYLTGKPLTFFSTLGRYPTVSESSTTRYQAEQVHTERQAKSPERSGKAVLELAARIQELPPDWVRMIEQLVDKLHASLP